MKNFIELNEHRIRKTSIKEYKPIGATKLTIYFSHSRHKVESLVFDFGDQEIRDEKLEILDNIL